MEFGRLDDIPTIRAFTDAGVENRIAEALPGIYSIYWKNCIRSQEFETPQFSMANPKLELIQEDKLTASEKGTAWVIFHDGEEGELYHLSERVKAVGFNVVFVPFKTLVSEDEVDKILGNLKSSLEGILYVVTNKMEIELERMIVPLLYILKFTLKRNLFPKILIFTDGVWTVKEGHENSVGNQEPQRNPESATLWGIVRCARLEIPRLKSKLIDLDPCKYITEQLEEVRFEMWLDDKETEVAYRDGIRYLRRLENHQDKARNVSNSKLKYPTCEKFALKSLTNEKNQDLNFVKNSGIGRLGPMQMEIKVFSTSLGYVKDKAVIDFAGTVCGVGSEVVNFQVGDPVYGWSPNEIAISTHVTTDQNFVVRMPKDFTFSEAATLPTEFLTAYIALVEVGKLSAEQTLLIYDAPGGAGLAAVQIAKILGAKVIVTAETPKQRKYLRALGLTHVYNSINLDFGDKIKEITNGKGVNVILNSLNGPDFQEAFLNLIMHGGYFIEISKRKMFTEEDAQNRMPHVNCKIVNLAALKPEYTSGVLRKLSKFVGQGLIKPLPYTRFFASDTARAVSFLQKAGHVGKVVVEMPVLNPTTNLYEEKLFNNRSSYLITGGKSGVGLAIAEWMVAEGAKYIILVGRSPPSDEAQNVVQKLEDIGAAIWCVQLDISDYSQCEKFLKNLKNEGEFPTLRGIHHCAVVLMDKKIKRQDWERFEHVFKPKIYGARNLHRLTMGQFLEFFVLHSSIAATFGNIGQSNYAAANLYLDSLAELRLDMGLPGLSVSWGLWEAGLAVGRHVKMARHFPITHGTNALAYFLRENVASGVAADINFSYIATSFPDYVNTFLENIPPEEKLQEICNDVKKDDE